MEKYKLIIEIEMDDLSSESAKKTSKLLRGVQYQLENHMINTQAIRSIERIEDFGDKLIKVGEWKVNKNL